MNKVERFITIFIFIVVISHLVENITQAKNIKLDNGGYINSIKRCSMYKTENERNMCREDVTKHFDRFYQKL